MSIRNSYTEKPSLGSTERQRTPPRATTHKHYSRDTWQWNAEDHDQRGGKRFYYSATVGSKDHVLHLKLMSASNEKQPLTIHIEGAKGVHLARVNRLHSATGSGARD